MPIRVYPISVMPGDLETSWAPVDATGVMLVPSSRFIDRVNEALRYRPRISDADVVATYSFGGLGTYEARITAEDFRRYSPGTLVSRGLDLVISRVTGASRDVLRYVEVRVDEVEARPGWSEAQVAEVARQVQEHEDAYILAMLQAAGPLSLEAQSIRDIQAQEDAAFVAHVDESFAKIERDRVAAWLALPTRFERDEVV